MGNERPRKQQEPNRDKENSGPVFHCHTSSEFSGQLSACHPAASRRIGFDHGLSVTLTASRQKGPNSGALSSPILGALTLLIVGTGRVSGLGQSSRSRLC